MLVSKSREHALVVGGERVTRPVWTCVALTNDYDRAERVADQYENVSIVHETTLTPEKRATYRAQVKSCRQR